jgi:hypothetical protein
VEVAAKEIVDWVEQNLPPLSWQIIVMQNMKVFMKHKVTPSKFNDTTMLNADVVRSIGLLIKERYNKELPPIFK